MVLLWRTILLKGTQETPSVFTPQPYTYHPYESVHLLQRDERHLLLKVVHGVLKAHAVQETPLVSSQQCQTHSEHSLYAHQEQQIEQSVFGERGYRSYWEDRRSKLATQQL